MGHIWYLHEGAFNKKKIMTKRKRKMIVRNVFLLSTFKKKSYTTLQIYHIYIASYKNNNTFVLQNSTKLNFHPSMTWPMSHKEGHDRVLYTMDYTIGHLHWTLKRHFFDIPIKEEFTRVNCHQKGDRGFDITSIQYSPLWCYNFSSLYTTKFVKLS